MANVAGSFLVNTSWIEIATVGIQPNNLVQPLLQNLQIANGTGALQVDSIYANLLTLPGSTVTIDLTSLTSPSGAAVNLARARLFLVYNSDSTAGHDVKVSQGASNGWAQLPAAANAAVARANGGIVILWDPNSTGAGNGNVVTSTSKTILFDPGVNTISPKLQVFILGGSAA